MIEDLAHIIDGNARNRHMAARNARLTPNALGDGAGLLKKRVQHRSRRRLFLRELIGPADLARDLAFADDQAVEAAGDAEKMPNGIGLPALVQATPNALDGR